MPPPYLACRPFLKCRPYLACRPHIWRADHIWNAVPIWQDSTMPWNLDGYPDEPERWRAWRKERLGLWEDLADSITPHALAAVSSGSIGLPQVPEYAQRILDGKVAGRLVIEIEPEE
mmetsp:Transcript_69984/g.210242  ORF Transcript_69984/g.210242 Transcript_69984/m.210242 type:complete len:117 (+) Transcript_69984:239-589(+)